MFSPFQADFDVRFLSSESRPQRPGSLWALGWKNLKKEVQVPDLRLRCLSRNLRVLDGCVVDNVLSTTAQAANGLSSEIDLPLCHHV